MYNFINFSYLGPFIEGYLLNALFKFIKLLCLKLKKLFISSLLCPNDYGGLSSTVPDCFLRPCSGIDQLNQVRFGLYTFFILLLMIFLFIFHRQFFFYNFLLVYIPIHRFVIINYFNLEGF